MSTIEEKKLFIGMPVYNGEQFIHEAISSLLSQTHKNISLFISDDSSTDDTEKICRAYKKKDARVTYIRQKKNLGMIGNFNFVLNHADAPFFMWASQDDIWEKDFVSTCISNLQKNPTYSLAFTGVCNIDSKGRRVREYPEFPRLSGKVGFKTVCKHLWSPEIMGKCLLLYGIFRTDACRNVLENSPFQDTWGSDNIFSLAVISRYGAVIDSRMLFKKRIGGISSAHLKESGLEPRMIVIKNPKNHIFPVGGKRFTHYLTGNMRAVPRQYVPLVFIVLLLRSVRAWILFLKTRNYKKYFKIKN